MQSLNELLQSTVLFQTMSAVEKDNRHGKADFAKETERAPEDLKHLFADVEFIDFERREYKVIGMVQEIIRQAGLSIGEPEPETKPSIKFHGFAVLDRKFCWLKKKSSKIQAPGNK